MDINEKNSQGITPLIAMIQMGCEEGVLSLLDAGADIDGRDSSLRTPLHHAVMFNEVSLVSLLTEHGCLLDLTDDHGRTPLFCAVANGFDLIVGYLCSRNADLNIRDFKDVHLLDVAPESTKELLLGK